MTHNSWFNSLNSKCDCPSYESIFLSNTQLLNLNHGLRQKSLVLGGLLYFDSDIQLLHSAPWTVTDNTQTGPWTVTQQFLHSFFVLLLLVTAWIHRTWRVFGWIQLKAPTVGRKRATKRLSLLMRDRFHLTVFRNTHISSVRTERIGGTVQRRQNSDGIWSRARQVQLLRQSLLWIIERV